MRACDKVARRPTCFTGRSAMTQRGDTRFAHFPTHALPFSSHIACDTSFSIDVWMHTIHSAAPPVYHVHAQHYMTLYCTHSSQPGVVLLCLLLRPPATHHFTISKATLTCLFTQFVHALARLCSRICLFLFF